MELWRQDVGLILSQHWHLRSFLLSHQPASEDRAFQFINSLAATPGERYCFASLFKWSWFSMSCSIYSFGLRHAAMKVFFLNLAHWWLNAFLFAIITMHQPVSVCSMSLSIHRHMVPTWVDTNCLVFYLIKLGEKGNDHFFWISRMVCPYRYIHGLHYMNFFFVFFSFCIKLTFLSVPLHSLFTTRSFIFSQHLHLM